jgi:hypothetical protein
MPPATAPKTVRLFMWEISLPLADRLFTLSNAVLIIGAAMVLIGTIGAIVLSGVREQFSNARISDNETKTALAVAESDTAKQGAAEANARALEAQLALTKYRSGRSLLPEQHKILFEALKAAPKGRVIIKPNFADAEATSFANQITQIFVEAGFSGAGDAPLQIISINRTGVFLAVRDGNKPPPDTDPILRAFAAAGIPVDSGYADWVPDLDTVVIVVGTKP